MGEEGGKREDGKDLEVSLLSSHHNPGGVSFLTSPPAQVVLPKGKGREKKGERE